MQTNEQMRRNSIESLSTHAIRQWKAAIHRGGSLEPEDHAAFWDSILEDLYGNTTLRSNFKYNGKFSEYCERLYGRCSCPLVKVVPTIVQYAMDTTDRIVDLQKALGIWCKLSQEWYEKNDAIWAICYMNGTWGMTLKYQVSWLFAHFEGQDSPKKKEGVCGVDGFLCTGKPGRAILERCKGYSLKAMESRMTVLQGFKKSLLPLDERDWLLTVEGTKESLTAEAPDHSEEIEDALIRTAEELRRKMPPVKVKNNYTLSLSSCVESTRSTGGFAGEFLESKGLCFRDFLGFKGRDSIGTYWRISPAVLVGDIRYHGKHQVDLIYSRMQYTYVDVYEENKRNVLNHLSQNGVPYRRTYPSMVQIRVVPEPFKFRVISVGEYDVYSMLKPWQEMMWKTLQRFEVFSLTGSGSDFLQEKVQRILSRYWDVGQKFLSGDYQEATNKLSANASKTIADHWFKDFPEFLYILDKTLFKTELNFCNASLGVQSLIPKMAADNPLQKERVMMSNGQLMGHPCSFPILCAVNAAMCRLALEKVWNRRFSLDDIPLLINGDDCLLIGPNSLLPKWREITQEVGLLESVGKSYFSDKFAMINSRYLRVDSVAVGIEDCPDRYIAYVKNDVGYINLGILVGRKKGSNVDCEVNTSQKVDDESAYDFWQSASDNYAQMNLRCRKLNVPLMAYVRSFKRFFDKIPLPLDVPKEQGGFGFSSERVLPWPQKNPFKLSLPGKVMLGEAYFSGGMTSCLVDSHFPDFLQESKKVGKILKRVVRRESLAWCEQDPKKIQWTATTAGKQVVSGGVDWTSTMEDPVEDLEYWNTENFHEEVGAITCGSYIQDKQVYLNGQVTDVYAEFSGCLLITVLG